MKPEGRKSPIVDLVKQKKLSTLMKPQLKTKSPENNFNKSSKTSLVANQLLSEVVNNRRNRLTRQSGSSRLVSLPRSNISKSQANLQSSSSHCLRSQSQDNFKQLAASVKKEHRGPFVKPITPKIMITNCSNLEKLVENKEMVKISLKP